MNMRTPLTVDLVSGLSSEVSVPIANRAKLDHEDTFLCSFALNPAYATYTIQVRMTQSFILHIVYSCGVMCVG